jgi:hypothetical protein
MYNSQMSDDLTTKSYPSYSELQKEYDFLTEEIQFLRKSNRTEDLSPREKFRLQQQIEEAETERELIGQKLKTQELESSIAHGSHGLYRSLLRLGYRKQIRLFRQLIEAESIAAFLIHGYPDYGQCWLLNRLVVQYVPHLLNGKVIKVYASRKVRRNDVCALWREVAGRVGLKGRQYTPTEISSQICQCLQTQNVLLILHEVEKIPETTFYELVQDFWVPLVNQVRSQGCENSKFKLLLFLVDYEGCVGSWEMPFSENLSSNWEPQTPVKSPFILEFSDKDLVDWIETEYDNLPPTLTNSVDSIVQTILDNSENGIPELVLDMLCDHCDCDWYEESKQWLSL